MKLPILQVSQFLFRSPQPEFEDMLWMKKHGIKGLINLREEATESQFFARQAGLNYLYLPVTDWCLPAPEQVDQFLEFLGSADNTPSVVHCAMGVGRTGTFVACHRVNQGMNVEEALALTNRETPLPGVTMNQEQQDFVRRFSLRS